MPRISMKRTTNGNGANLDRNVEKIESKEEVSFFFFYFLDQLDDSKIPHTGTTTIFLFSFKQETHSFNG